MSLSYCFSSVITYHSSENSSTGSLLFRVYVSCLSLFKIEKKKSEKGISPKRLNGDKMPLVFQQLPLNFHRDIQVSARKKLRNAFEIYRLNRDGSSLGGEVRCFNTRSRPFPLTANQRGKKEQICTHQCFDIYLTHMCMKYYGWFFPWSKSVS